MSLRYELILRVQRNNRNMKCLCILPLVLAPNVLNSHDWMLLSLGRNARTYKPSIVWTSGQPVFETKTSIWGSALIRTSGTLWNWSLSIYVDHEQTLGTRRKIERQKKVSQKFSSIWKNISTSPGRDASPSQVIRSQFVRSNNFAVSIYTPGWRETLRDTVRHSVPSKGSNPDRSLRGRAH